MTKPKLFTALLLLLLAGGLFAERDSLCMRIVDEWDIDTGTTYTMLAGDDYLLGTIDNKIYICSLDSLGIPQGDSLILTSYRMGSGYSCLKDTLLFLTYNPEAGIDSCHIFNMANPYYPDKIKSFHLYDGVEPYYQVVQDTILFLLNFRMKLSLANLDSNTLISTMIDLSCDDIDVNSFSFPYLYELFIHHPAISDACPWILRVSDWSSNDTIYNVLNDTLRTDSYPHSYRSTKSQYVQDTILFASILGSSEFLDDSSFIATIGYSSTRDSAWVLSMTKDFHRYRAARGIGYIWVFDSLLIMVTGNAINIFNISNPLSIDEVAYYYNEGYSFKTPILRDSLLYINYNRGDTAGIATFEYPCTTCSGNCELEQELPNELNIDVYPNPFNSRCSIKYSLMRNDNPSLSIYDVRGRSILSQALPIDSSEFIWNASHEPSGVYLVVLFDGDNRVSRKLILMK